MEGREEQYPYLYKTGETLKLRKAKWLLPGLSLEGPFYVSGEGTEEYNFAEVEAESEITSEGTEVWIENIKTEAGAFPEEVKNFDNAFQIQWKLRLEGHTELWDAGTSSNPIYVCLLGARQGKNPCWEVVDGACQPTDDSTYNRGGHARLTSNIVTPSGTTAFLNTWNKKYASQKYKLAVLDLPLYYYEANSTFDGNAKTVLPLLFLLGTGQCKAWVDLLAQETALNDTDYRKIKVNPISPFNWFLVKEWKDVPSLFFTEEWWFRFGGKKFDMVDPLPQPDPLLYGDVRNDTSGIPGQNTSCPSQKVFGQHYILYLNDTKTFYDPSYGTTYEGEFGDPNKTAEKKFTENLYALGKTNNKPLYNGRKWLTLHRPLISPWVTFEAVK